MVRFSPKVERKLYQALKGSFPDAKIDDADMLALAICISRQKKGNGSLPADLRDIDLDDHVDVLEREAAKVPRDEIQTLDEPDDGYRYYWTEAVHNRKSPQGFQPFTAQMGMVRVTLPETRPRKYKTAFGVLAPGDHLIDTVYEANQKYKAHLGYEMQRLDVITPARQSLRFGAISVYLGFAHEADIQPSCYILEAGTATGQPKVLYLGKKIGQDINAYSGYQPTPFACSSHAYFGTLTVKDDDEPDRLLISSRVIKDGASQPPYIEVDIRWTLQTGKLKNVWPGFLLARAAAIVIERASKRSIPTDCRARTPGANHA